MKERKKNPVFESYEDLYNLTNKTADEHIQFFTTRKTKIDEDLWEIYNKLSEQSKRFENIDWTNNWINWSKNLHAFEKHCMEAKFLIENYLREVLEELLIRQMNQYKKLLEKYESTSHSTPPKYDEVLFKMLKKEIKKSVKEELRVKKRVKNENN